MKTTDAEAEVIPTVPVTEMKPEDLSLQFGDVLNDPGDNKYLLVLGENAEGVWCKKPYDTLVNGKITHNWAPRVVLLKKDNANFLKIHNLKYTVNEKEWN